MANGKTSWEIARQNGINEDVIIKSRFKRALAAQIDCIIVKNDFVKSHDFTKAKHKIDSLRELLNIL